MPKLLRVRKKSRVPTWTFNETTNCLEEDQEPLPLPKVLRQAARRQQGSKLESKVASDLAALGLMEGCQKQYRFHPVRKWLFDFAWPSRKIALEVNGGTYLRGSARAAHSRGPRQRQDYEKWSEAAILGWTVILVDAVDVRQRVHVDRVLRAMEVV